MALYFPPNPTEGQTHFDPSNGVTYTYKNGGWVASGGTQDDLDLRYVEVAGDNMTGDLTLGTDKITLKAADGSGFFSSAVGIGNRTNPVYAVESQRNSNLLYRFVDSDGVTTTGVRAISDPEGVDFAPLGTDAGFIWRTTNNSGTQAKTVKVFRTAIDISDNLDINPTKLQINPITGTTQIGGVIPSSPNITLAADGSITAAGDITTSSANAAMRIISTGTDSYASLRLKNDAKEYHWQIDGFNDSFRLYDADNATTLISVQSNGDFYLGGALPGSGSPIFTPNITLKADGSASFQDSITLLRTGTPAQKFTHSVNSAGNKFISNSSVGNAKVLDFDSRTDDAFGAPTGGNLGYYFRVQGDIKAAIDADGTFGIGGNPQSAPNITLAADGSITAVRDIKLGSSSDIGLDLISVVSTVPAPQLHGYIATGSAFAGGVNGDLLIAGRTTSASHIRFLGGTNNTKEFMRIYATGNVGIGGTIPSAQNISLNADGSASFGGNVDIGDGNILLNADGSIFTGTNVSSAQEAQYGLVVKNNYAGGSFGTVIARQYNAAGNTYIGAKPDGDVTFKVTADGSASFKGTNRAVVYVQTDDLTGSPANGVAGTMLQTGTVFATRGGNTNIWEGRAEGSIVVTSSIKPDGSATFAGTVTSNGTILTRAGGVTLDVGDRLEKVDAALTGLKAALVSTTDHASLKAALIAALADI